MRTHSHACSACYPAGMRKGYVVVVVVVVVIVVIVVHITELSSYTLSRKNKKSK